jgi:hypothetical protein
VLALAGELRRLFQVKLQAVPGSDGIEAVVRLAECEAELVAVIGNRRTEVVDEELRSKGGEARPWSFSAHAFLPRSDRPTT